MIDLNWENYRRNAELLLQGIWYSNLPYMLDLDKDELIGSVDRLFDEIPKRILYRNHHPPRRKRRIAGNSR